MGRKGPERAGSLRVFEAFGESGRSDRDTQANQPVFMFSRLFLLFVVVPAVELYLLIKIGQWIGAAETFILILVTGLIGSAMAKVEGLAVWGRFNRRMAEGKVPGKELLDGIIILVSGAFLITPGVLTDAVGLLGLFPPTRALIRGVLMERISRKGTSAVRGIFVSFGQTTGTSREKGSAASSGQPGESAASPNGSTRISGTPKSRPAHESERAESGDEK